MATLVPLIIQFPSEASKKQDKFLLTIIESNGSSSNGSGNGKRKAKARMSLQGSSGQQCPETTQQF